MRRLIGGFFVGIFALSGCYSPDYTQRECNTTKTCPDGYGCYMGKCRVLADIPVIVEDMRMPDDMAVVGPLPGEVAVTGGIFTIGSNVNDGIIANDSPPNTRTVSDYYMDEKEVTIAQYRQCVLTGKCELPKTGTNCNYAKAGLDDTPVNCVDLNQAKAYCGWVGKRLPTEDEWEFAAVGKSSVKYTFGDTFSAANVCFNKNNTCSVGSFPKTFQGTVVSAIDKGFYDLNGNVWEWTSSEFCPYMTNQTSFTCGGSKFVVRGASGFDTDPKLFRATVRLGNAPTDWFQNLGFRCARNKS